MFATFFGVKCTVNRYGRNSWAVCTGCTEGIGLAQAHYLAKQGFNIVLISRSQEKLQRVAKDLEEHTFEGKNCKTRIIVCDFSKDFNAEHFQKMYDASLSDLDISILCNNVG